jgi:hypothetical protein
VRAVELAIDDPDGGTERVQLRGKRETRGAGADDENAQLLVELGHVVPSGRQTSQHYSYPPTDLCDRAVRLVALRRPRPASRTSCNRTTSRLRASRSSPLSPFGLVS